MTPNVTPYSSVNVRRESLDRLRRTILLVRGGLYGNLVEEATRAIEAHELRLREEAAGRA
jgi:hypothetical protein